MTDTSSSIWKDLTPDEETQFRQWARANYDPGAEVVAFWHPVVRDECAKMNDEIAALSDQSLRNATVYVVLTPHRLGGYEVEVLDSPPRWSRQPGQACFVANVNGGDSIEWTEWATT